MKVKAIIFLCVGFIGACAGDPGVPAGPALAAGPLHGRLEQGVYHDSNDWYAVTLPYHPGEESYLTLNVNEEYPPYISYSAFTPTDTAGEYYRVYVEDFSAGNHPIPDMDHVADAAMRFFGRQLVQQRLEPLRFVVERPWQAGSTTGLLRLYTEKVPMQAIQNRFSSAVLGEDYTAIILIYVTTRQGKVAVLWTEWADGCAPCRPPSAGPPAKTGDPIDRALAKDARAGEFIASFMFSGG
jgi:hypothetical protein